LKFLAVEKRKIGLLAFCDHICLILLVIYCLLIHKNIAFILNLDDVGKWFDIVIQTEGILIVQIGVETCV